MELFRKVFDILNGIENKKGLDKIGFKLVDLEYSKVAFYSLQKSFNENRGKSATAQTLLKTVADFYKNNGFSVSENNGIYFINYKGV